MAIDAGERDDLLRELAEARERIAELERGRSVDKLNHDQIADSSPTLLFIAGYDGDCQRINAAFEATLGYSKGEVASLLFADIFHAEDREAAASHFQTMIASQSVICFEGRALHKDGSNRWISWTVLPLTSRQLVYAMGQDITNRKMAEDEIRRNEDKWRSLISLAPVFICIVDREGRITYLNRAVDPFTVEDAIGQTAFSFTHPDYHHELTKALEIAFEQDGEYSFESRAAGVHGDDNWYMTHVSPAKMNGRISGATFVAIDITDRRRAEDALRRSNEQFSALVETTSDWIWETNSTGVYTYSSPKVVDILGYTADEVVGMSCFDLMPPDERDRVREAFLVSVERKEPITNLVNVNRHKEGHEVILETSGVPFLDGDGELLGFRGIDRDITERRRIVAELRTSEERFRSLFATSSVGIFLADTRGIIVLANHAASGFLGQTQQELVGMHVTDFSHPEDSGADFMRFQELVAGQRDAYTVERRHVRKDGSVVWGRSNVALIRDTQRMPQFAVFVCEDITDRKHTEAALRAEQMRMRSQLRAQDHERQVIAFEIHDGPAQHLVAAMMAFDSYDHFRTSEPDMARDQFREARNLLKQCLSETRRIISGVRPPVLHELGLAAALENLACEISSNSEAELELHHSMDSRRFEPVLENTVYRVVQEGLNNAIQHSRSHRVRIVLTQKTGFLQVEVRDWGIGFDSDNLDETSMGLKGMRERTALLGGELSVNSRPGAGTWILARMPIQYLDGDQSSSDQSRRL